MGRKTTVNVKENKHYFAEYYHKTNEDHVCECGCKYLLHSKRRHLMSIKHKTLMEFKTAQEELNKLNLAFESNSDLRSVLGGWEGGVAPSSREVQNLPTESEISSI